MQKIKRLIATTALLTMLVSPVALAQGQYGCGTYGGGSYDTGNGSQTNCAATLSETGEENTWLIIALSLALIAGGITLAIVTKRHHNKRANIKM